MGSLIRWITSPLGGVMGFGLALGLGALLVGLHIRLAVVTGERDSARTERDSYKTEITDTWAPRYAQCQTNFTTADSKVGDLSKQISDLSSKSAELEANNKQLRDDKAAAERDARARAGELLAYLNQPRPTDPLQACREGAYILKYGRVP